MTENLIIFLATESYLSCPQYFSILPHLEKHKKILLNVNEQWSSILDKDYLEKNQKKILRCFYKYHELKGINLNAKKRLWNVLMTHYNYKKLISNYLDIYHPKAVICCSDMNLIHRTINYYCIKK